MELNKYDYGVLKQAVEYLESNIKHRWLAKELKKIIREVRIKNE